MTTLEEKTLATSRLDSPPRVLLDLETDGLLDTVNTVWCMSLVDIDTGSKELFTNYSNKHRDLDYGLEIISNASTWSGHNVIGFDCMVLKKLYPGVAQPHKIIDTLILSRLLYPEVGLSSISKKLKPTLKHSHSLEAWGKRLGTYKGDFEDWTQYSEDMADYCLQDGAVSLSLLKHLRHRSDVMGVEWDFDNLSKCVCIEHEFAKHIADQVDSGFYFNDQEALKLSSQLEGRRDELCEEMRHTFEPKFKYKQLKTKCNIWWESFNPASRQQVAERLIEMGWVPTEFTKKGRPKVDADTLESLGTPEAAKIIEYLLLDKRVGALANGANAWLKLSRGGKIHGQVNTIGAVTGRVTHNSPNLSQVPAIYKPYGPECRALFGPKPGWIQVGADLSGIELRCLAHYMARWDGGEYADVILNGDIHTANQQAAGLPTRNNAKTFIYGYLYGAGDEKLGTIVDPTKSAEVRRKIGAELRKTFEAKIPALGNLSKAVKSKMKDNKGYLSGMDGRPLFCRSSHSSLNTLLQSAGAITAKVWYVMVHRELENRGYTYGEDYTCLGFFHDEIQLSVKPGLDKEAGEVAIDMAASAGVVLGYRLPIGAEYKTGKNWKETH